MLKLYHLLFLDLKFLWVKKIQLFSFFFCMAILVPIVFSLPVLETFILSDSIDFLANTVISNALLTKNISALIGLVSSSYIIIMIVFYTVLYSNKIISDLDNKAWLIFTNSNFSLLSIVFSKIIVFGLSSGSLMTLVYLLTYVSLSHYIMDVPFTFIVVRSLVVFLVFFLITSLTILISVISKNKTFVISTILSFFVFLPDLLFMLNINRYFPTYSITFIFSSDALDHYLLLALFSLILIMLSLLVALKFKIKHAKIY
jgi:hypothetical protein